MREPLAFAQRDARQEPVAVSEDERDSVSSHQPESITDWESLSRVEPDPDSVREPDSVAEPVEIALA